MGSADIEWVKRIQPRTFRAVLFDFDGTISLIRQGWQEIMYSYFVEVLQATPQAESEEELWAVVKEFVDRLTGKQTIYQTMQLCDEVSTRGGVPLDPLTYKHAYLDRLWQRIAHRVAGLEDGRLEAEQFTVPGSRELLQDLTERGLTLYLASGTDEKYVLHEVKALGLAHFFVGGIYGALDDYKKFSKAMIIERLISENQIRGDELLGFGDGYVEIENVKEVGGIAIGVASNEETREGMDPWKRTRLIEAGADAIVGDYRCRQELLAALGLGNKEA